MMISSSGNFIQKTTRKNPKVSVVLGAYMVELQVMTGKGHREISFDIPGYGSNGDCQENTGFARRADIDRKPILR